MDITIKNLNKSYKNKVLYKDFDIVFKENSFNTIVGKSGCGKTTLLKIVSNLEEKDSGEISGVNLNSLSYVFQEDRLVDWLNVKDNIKLAIESSYKKEEIDAVCDKYLQMVGLSEYKEYYPQMLSGGLRQRVNIARGFAKPSEIIILDEPFKSIDIKNKKDIMKAVEQVILDENRTVLFVTHDIDEAVYFDGYIYVFGENPVQVVKYYDTAKIIDPIEHQKFKDDIIETI
jgi:NitT/TauT family transport system ATP-binding protein